MKKTIRVLVTGLALSAGGLTVQAATVSTPPFADGFESYTVDAALSSVDHNGWNASSNNVLIQTNTFRPETGAKAVIAPPSQTITNTVDGTGFTSLWTDYYINETNHMEPGTAQGVDPSAILMLYIGTNGYVSVYDTRSNDYVVCSHDVWDSPLAPLTNGWARISIHKDFVNHVAAIFLNDHCLRIGLPFININASSYSRFQFDNGITNDLYLDDVLITNNVPAGMIADVDKDSMPDAQEIQIYGNLTTRHRPIITVTATNLTLGVAGGGTFNTAASFDVDYSGSTNFVLTANPDYYVAGALTNGTSVGGLLSGLNTGSGSFTFSGITDNSTVTAQFARVWNITAVTNTVGGPGGSGGGIVLSAVKAYPNTTVGVTASAEMAFIVTDILTNTVSVGSFTGVNTRNATYTSAAITADLEVKVVFTYTAVRAVPADYATLGAALTAAAAGDTITVSNGTYALSEPLVINKALTLTGNTSTPSGVIITAPGSGDDRDCFQVQAHNVTIQGFRLSGALNGASPNPGWLNAGIMVGNNSTHDQMATNATLEGLTNGVFRNLEITGCSHGIYSHQATRCVATRSTISGSTTGVWANAELDARSNWWGAATGPSGEGPGTGDPISANVLYAPWFANAAGTQYGFHVPASGDLQAAMDAAQDGDWISLGGGTYSGSLSASKSVTLFGAALAITGTVTLSPGKTLTLNNAVTAAGLTLSSGSAGLTGSGSLTAATGTVGANASLNVTNSTLTLTTLSIASGGQLATVNTVLTIGGLGFVSTITLDSSWGGVTSTLVPQSLPYYTGFESFAHGAAVNLLGAYGWAASSASSIIQSNVVNVGIKALKVATDSAVSNAITSATGVRVWTDCYLNETAHVTDETKPSANDADTSLMLYLNSDGHVVVYDRDTTAWLTLSNDFTGVRVVGPGAGAWTRVSVFQDYDTHKAAIFVDGHLMRDSLSFNPARSSYSHFKLDSGTQGPSYLDEVRIATNLPPSFGGNYDGDDLNDATEVMRYGTATGTIRSQGSIYLIR